VYRYDKLSLVLSIASPLNGTKWFAVASGNLNSKRFGLLELAINDNSMHMAEARELGDLVPLKLIDGCCPCNMWVALRQYDVTERCKCSFYRLSDAGTRVLEFRIADNIKIVPLGIVDFWEMVTKKKTQHKRSGSNIQGGSRGDSSQSLDRPLVDIAPPIQDVEPVAIEDADRDPIVAEFDGDPDPLVHSDSDNDSVCENGLVGAYIPDEDPTTEKAEADLATFDMLHPDGDDDDAWAKGEYEAEEAFLASIYQRCMNS
jgi:hypothetical protein